MRLLNLKVAAIIDEAAGVKSFRLVDATGAELPTFNEGAHIDLRLGERGVRSYSLCGPSSDRDAYEIAVAVDAGGRGASVFLHETVRVGDEFVASPPRNHFPLNEGAAHSVLLAGGIGITPIFAMVRRLETLGRSWRLYYAARNRGAAAFRDRLSGFREKVRFHFDDEKQGVFDIAAALASEPEDAHFYCCGPAPMLRAFETAVATRDPERVHLEYFSTPAEPRAADDAFLVYLARSKRTLEIRPGVSILDTLLDSGFEMPFSCGQGTCGECEVKVLAGEPEHRDTVLSKKKRAENRAMMICCSRSKSAELTLDL